MENSARKIFNSKKDIFYFIIGIVVILFLIYFGFKSITFLGGVAKVVINEYPTIAVALITGLLAFVSVIVGKFFENKYIINNKIREERQLVYIDFLGWLIDNVLYDEISKNKQIVEEIKKQQKNMTIYASDKVLKAWCVFKDTALNSEKNKLGLSDVERTRYFILHEAPKIENLILAIRKELGYKNENIQPYDILKLYINDINDYL